MSKMNIARFVVAIGFVALGAMFAPRAHAEVVLLDQAGFVSGKQSFVFELQAPGAGTMHVQLSNLCWPDRLASVSFAATTATSVLKTLSDAGTTSFSVSGPGAYYAHVAGAAQGALNLGLYSLRVTFESGVAPVPLPAAVWLLLSGLGAVACRFRRRESNESFTYAT